MGRVCIGGDDVNKLFYVGWMLLNLQNTSPQINIENNILTIEAQETFEGYVFKDDTLFYEIVAEEELEEIQDLEAGIYTLYDSQGEMLDRKWILDDQLHISFNQMPQAQNEQNYLFQKQSSTFIISPIEDERYEGELKNSHYFYEINLDVFEFLETTYMLFVDDFKPVVKVENGDLLSEDTYITNTPNITLIYEDECPEMFQLYDQKEVEISLNEGINDLSSYLNDQANNNKEGKLWVVLDTEVPKINAPSTLYTNHDYPIMMDEPFLDMEKSYYLTPHQEKYFLEEEKVILKENGIYEFHLYDKASNESNIFLEVVYDQTNPMIYTSLDNHIFSYSFNEAIKTEDVKLSYMGDNIEINDREVVLEKEGIYELNAEFIDLSGNKTSMHKEIVVDYTLPELICSLNKKIYLQPIEIIIEGQDLFPVQWKIELYKNSELYKEFAGENDFKHFLGKNILNEDGIYELKVLICDGTYERVEQYEFVIDQKCEDISLKIDGSFANNVKELLLSDTAQFEINCIEGKVYYKLYKDDEMIEEGQSQVVEISSDQQIDTIEFYAFDQYGHKSSKIVHIQYPTILEVKPLQEAVEEIVVQKEEKKEEFNWMYIGGILFVLIGLRQVINRKNKFRQNKNNISSQQTVLLQNQAETKCLSTPKDS